MILGTGAYRYEVVDDWAKLPPGREFNADVAAVGEIGGGLGVNYDIPNIGPRVSIYSHQGELLGRLGQRPAGLEPGQFMNWGNRYKGQPPPASLRSLQKLCRLRA